jgi:hypothetical protein
MQLKLNRRTLLLTAALCLAALPARADRLDDLIRAEMERKHVPGLTNTIAAAIQPRTFPGLEPTRLASVKTSLPSPGRFTS